MVGLCEIKNPMNPQGGVVFYGVLSDLSGQQRAEHIGWGRVSSDTAGRPKSWSPWRATV